MCTPDDIGARKTKLDYPGRKSLFFEECNDDPKRYLLKSSKLLTVVNLVREYQREAPQDKIIGMCGVFPPFTQQIETVAN